MNRRLHIFDSARARLSRDTQGFHTYNLSSPYDDSISLDNFVDWLIDAACEIATEKFCAAAQAVGFEIPHMSAELINKYGADLRYLQLL